MSIRKMIKDNSVLSSCGYIIRSVYFSMKMKRYEKQKLDNHSVLFYRTGGGYGDNPKAIAEYLHQKYPTLRLVWTYKGEKNLESLPAYVFPVQFGSEAFFKELSTVGVWVCSTTLPQGTRKRNGQLYLQTWHGDKFLKKIANDAAKDVEAYRKRTSARKFCEPEICDYFITGCEWFVPVAASAFGYTGAFLRCGMPRNDCLVNLDITKCGNIKKRIGVGTEYKILIYAPTFRDYEKTHDAVTSDIDLVVILNALEHKYKCKWMCLMRAHDGKQLVLSNQRISDKRFIDVTTYPDMADLLMISDMLISDYSSCGADFAITGKMVLMYQDDIDQYTSKGRTLYFKREDSPYFTATNMNEALEIINSVTDDDILENSKGILDFYNSFEKGHACEEVCKVIIDSLGKIR